MRITISKQLIREHGSQGSALHMLGLADRVDSKGNIKPRNKHKRHTATSNGERIRGGIHTATERALREHLRELHRVDANRDTLATAKQCASVATGRVQRSIAAFQHQPLLRVGRRRLRE